MDPRAIVASLTSAQRHLVMIARALSNRPRVLMLDEPTASLSGTEVAALFGVLRRLKAQGVTMIYITHRLPEVLAICDRATVLRDGQVAAEIARPEFDADRFIFSMSGQRLNRLFPDHSPPAEPRTALEVRGLTVPGHPGAIFGAQRRQLRRRRRRDRRPRRPPRLRPQRDPRTAFTAASPPRARSASKAARSPIRSPRDARARRHRAPHRGPQARRPALQPAGRRQHHHRQPRATSRGRGLISGERERSAILDAMRALNVKAASPQASVAHLSGGNQQKLLFARVLMRAPRVLLLDEPTKGVDASTRAEIYRLVVELAETRASRSSSSPPSSRR